MTEKNRSPPLSDGTSTEAIEPTILFQKGQVHLYGIKIRYPQHGKDIRQLGVCRRRQNRTESELEQAVNGILSGQPNIKGFSLY